ncbi:MAG: hypothetical protein AAGJ94_09610 [Pseudomonadota bacterium]
MDIRRTRQVTPTMAPDQLICPAWGLAALRGGGEHGNDLPTPLPRAAALRIRRALTSTPKRVFAALPLLRPLPHHPVSCLAG